MGPHSGSLRWSDSEHDWWAKFRQADKRLSELRESEVSYLSQSPWTIRVEHSDRDDVSRVYFDLHEPIPETFSVTSGEILHNLSSALDAISFAIARENAGSGFLNDEEQQRRPEFPIVASRGGLNRWVAERRRRELYTDVDLALFWRAQSFNVMAEGFENGWFDFDRDSPKAELQIRRDPLHLLKRLSNIDKHRRLHVVLHGPNVPYWGSSGGESVREVRIVPHWTDGAVVAEIVDPPSDVINHDIQWDLCIFLSETGDRDLLVNLLDRLVGAVRQALMVISMSKDQ